MKKVLILMATYNGAKYLDEQIQSLIEQKNVQVDILVRDDGSTDNTFNILKKYESKLNLQYLYHPHNATGIAKSRNYGIKCSNSEICIFIDSGILVASDTVENFIKQHDKENDAAVIGYVYGFDRHNENEKMLLNLNIDPYKVDDYFNILEKNDILDPREKVYRKLGDDLKKWPAPWVFFWAGFISVKKDTLIKLGMFDENYNTWGNEDLDLGLALYTNNIDISLERKCKCIHYPHEKFKNNISKEELNKFKNKEADILIGTQMLSKGLDFDNVTLVGILSADMILNFPDFKSFETTFQLITQVSGRAGRSDKEGKVVLQTYDTDHYSIRRAINYDFEGFYEDEIKIRKAFGYAPFNNMISVVVSGENENLVKKNIQNMYDSIIYLLKGRGITDFEFILGPNPCSISKINQNYRWQILFKDDNIEINLLKGIIKYICITKRDVVFSKEINISIDINPNSVL